MLKKYVIKEVRAKGKWVEFIFEDLPLPEYLEYHESCKSYMLWGCVDDFDLEHEILNHGFAGKVLFWEKDRPVCIKIKE